MEIRIHQLVIPEACIFVQEIGHGAPIIFLHGNPDSGDLWLELARKLEDGYRCIMPDLPGFGRSTIEKDYSFSLENRGHFVEHVLNGLGVTEKVTVVVHDHGGPFGLTWVLQHPEKVQALCIFNTLYHADYRWHFWGRVWRTPVLGELHITPAGIPSLLTLFLLLEMRYHGGSRRLSLNHIRQTARLFTIPTHKVMLRLYRETNPSIFEGWDQRLLEQVKYTPTLILWGKRDPYLPADFPERLGRHGATGQFYGEYGHWAMAENPTLMASQLRDFLAHQMK